MRDAATHKTVILRRQPARETAPNTTAAWDLRDGPYYAKTTLAGLKTKQNIKPEGCVKQETRKYQHFLPTVPSSSRVWTQVALKWGRKSGHCSPVPGLNVHLNSAFLEVKTSMRCNREFLA